MIDAYAHVGRPRFGGAAEFLRFLDRAGVAQAVAVHGPGLVDGRAFEEIEAAAPGRCRFVSVPPPADLPRGDRDAAVARALEAGIVGFRLQKADYDEARLIAATGAAGGWLFAIDPFDDPAYAHTLLDWLDRHGAARVALPHFVKPDTGLLDRPGIAELLAHPKVFPILSRQTGASAEPFPYRDLWPWVERLFEAGAGERLLWASEYPVYLTRGEPLDSLTGWAFETGLFDASARAGFHGERARALFFGGAGGLRGDLPDFPPPAAPVPLKGFALDPDLHAALLARHMADGFGAEDYCATVNRAIRAGLGK